MLSLHTARWLAVLSADSLICQLLLISLVKFQREWKAVAEFLNVKMLKSLHSHNFSQKKSVWKLCNWEKMSAASKLFKNSVQCWILGTISKSYKFITKFPAKYSFPPFANCFQPSKSLNTSSSKIATPWYLVWRLPRHLGYEPLSVLKFMQSIWLSQRILQLLTIPLETNIFNGIFELLTKLLLNVCKHFLFKYLIF